MVTLDWRWFAFGSAMFAALTAIAGKVAVTQINSDLATFFRTIVILIVTASIVSIRNEWQRPADISSKSILFLTLSAVATGLSWLCYYRALQLAPASRVAPIDKLSVILVLVFAVTFLGEPLTWRIACGTFLIGAGVLLLAM